MPDEPTPEEDRSFDHGAEWERARIVAWLRTLPGDKGGTVAMSVGRSLGDRIEKGHHHA